MKLIVHGESLVNKKSPLIDYLVKEYKWTEIDINDKNLNQKINKKELIVILFFNYNRIEQLSKFIDIQNIKTIKVCYIESLLGIKRKDDYDQYDLILSPFSYNLAKNFLNDNLYKYHQIPYHSNNETYDNINSYPINEVLIDIKKIDQCRKYVGTVYKPLRIIKNKQKIYLIEPELFNILNSGSLLIIDKNCEEDFNKLNFKRDVHYVILTDENLTWVTNQKNREKIDKIRSSGMILLKNQNRIKDRANLINNLVIGKI